MDFTMVNAIRRSRYGIEERAPRRRPLLARRRLLRKDEPERIAPVVELRQPTPVADCQAS